MHKTARTPLSVPLLKQSTGSLLGRVCEKTYGPAPASNKDYLSLDQNKLSHIDLVVGLTLLSEKGRVPVGVLFDR